MLGGRSYMNMISMCLQVCLVLVLSVIDLLLNSLLLLIPCTPRPASNPVFLTYFELPLSSFKRICFCCGSSRIFLSFAPFCIFFMFDLCVIVSYMDAFFLMHSFKVFFSP